LQDLTPKVFGVSYDGNDIVAEIGGDAVRATYLRGLNIDEMFGILRQEGSYFSIYDGLGSTLALTDQAGASVVQYTYDPFGNTQSTNPAFSNPFQYTGRENDGTGLYYYRARYYSTAIQRFLSEDPIGLAGGINKYAYADNDPILEGDPTGLLTDKQIQDMADFATSVADAASFGIGPIARKYTDLDSFINQCSGAYKAGGWASLALGAGRLAYAGAAKALPFVIREGASELDRALAISGARNTLKRVFRFGLFPNWRMPTAAQILEATNRDPAQIIEKSTRTNPVANAIGANAAAGSAVNLSTSKCGCE